MTRKVDAPRDQAIAKGADHTNRVGTNGQVHCSFPPPDLGDHAIEYGSHGWPVFPLSGKIPAIKGGHGVKDATTDLDQITAWWGGRYAGCNIGIRPPDSVIVLDIDPRHGGDETLAALEAETSPLPVTLTTVSGRGDGGKHLYFRRPAGKLKNRLGDGIDLKTSAGYVVAAPSIHPDTGQPYRRIDHPVAAPPPWLAALLRPRQPVFAPVVRPHLTYTGPPVADEYSSAATWPEILGPHGWRCLDPDPDADGARWRHPNATSTWSATIKYELLFVYSPNTPFEVTEHSDPHGYTKFRAYAVLNHGGDQRAAARELSTKAR